MFLAVTEIHGRTFGTWTLLTCTLCLLCAWNLHNKPHKKSHHIEVINTTGSGVQDALLAGSSKKEIHEEEEERTLHG